MFHNLLSSARRHTLVVLAVTMALLAALVPGAVAQTEELKEALPPELQQLAQPAAAPPADSEAAKPADPQPTDPQLSDPTYIDRLKSSAATQKWEPGKEIFSRRSLTSKTFMGKQPGQFETRLYTDAIHFRDGDRLSEIDSSLGEVTAGKRKARANKFGLELAESADNPELARVQLDADRSVGFGLDKASRVKGKVTKDTITYSKVANNTDIKLTSQRNGLKEEIILSAPGAPGRFVFPLILKGLTASIEPNGDVVYKDSNKVERARTPRGFMFDSRVDPLSGEPASSTGVDYALIPRGKGVALQVTLTDRAWIDSAERVWPLIVDPGVGIRTNTDDTYVMKNFNRNNSGDPELKVGTYDGGVHIGRSYARFETGVLAGAVINSATLYAAERHSWNCGVGVGPVFRVNAPWSGADTNWEPAATDPNQATGGWYPGYGPCPNRLAFWNVTPQVVKMASINEQQGSFSFRAFNEGDNNQYKKYVSFEGGNGPYLSVDYTVPIAPGPPPNPVATANNDGKVGVTWGNSSTQGGSPIDFYVGYSYFANGTYSDQYQVSYCTGNCNYALFDNLVQNQSQKFWIYAHNTAGYYSTPTGSNLVTPRVITVPSPPTNPSAVVQGAGTVKVTWNLSASDGGSAIVQYTVFAYRQVSGSFVYDSRYSIACGTCTQTTLTGLTAGDTYLFAIYASNGVGNSTPATTTVTLPPSGPPTAPTGVGATAGDRSANVGWSPSTADSANGATIAGYQVQAYSGTTPVLSPLTVAGDKTSAVFPGLTNGQPYNFKVTATDSLNKSSAASAASNTVIPEVSGVARSDQTGLEDFYPYRAFDLGQGSAFANMATGNLVVQDEDFNVPGQGLNMRLSRTYNANQDGAVGPFGRGWTLGVAEGEGDGGLISALGTLDLGQILVLLSGSGSMDFIDADGTRHRFIKQGGAWQSPPGVNLTLSELLGVYTLTRPDGVSYRVAQVGNSLRLTQIADRKGNMMNLAYQGDKLRTITDTVGRTLTFTQPDNLITRVSFGAAGNTLNTDYGYTGDRLVSVTQAAGTPDAVTTEYTYSGDGLRTVKDGRGNSTTFDLPAGKLAKITDRAGKPWSFGYTSGGCVAQAPATAATCLSDPEANTQVWSTNPAGNLLFRSDAGDVTISGAARINTAGYEWGTSGTANNRLTKATDEAANTTSYSYDSLGQITGSVASRSGEPSFSSEFIYQYPALSPGVGEMISSETGKATAQARVQTFSYPNGNGTIGSTTDPQNKITTFSYYVRGLLRTVTDANGKTTSYGDTALGDGGYDPSGAPKKITDPTGAVTGLQFDYLGRMTKKTDREQKDWFTEYDRRGNATRSTDPLGQATLSCYDANNNPVLVVPPRAASQNCGLDGTDGNSIKTSYTARDQVGSTLTKSDGKLRKSTYEYNDDGTLNQILQPRSFNPATGAELPTLQKASYLYYPNNRISAFIDEQGGRTDVLYTPHGLPEKVTDPVSTGTKRSVTSYSYNRRGQVLSSLQAGYTNPTGLGYNLHGDRTSTTPPKGNTTFTEYDKMSRPTRVTDPGGKVSNRTYDPVGNLLTLTQPKDLGGQLTTSYSYTSRNELLSETDPADAARLVEYSYDAEGRQKLRNDKYNGTTERTTEQKYRADGSLLERRATGTGLSEQKAVFGYDPGGNTSSVKTYKDGAANPNISQISATHTSAGELKTLDESIFGPTGTPVTVSSSFDWAQDALLNARTTDGKTSEFTYDLNGRERTFKPFDNPGTKGFTNTWLPNGSLQSTEMPNGSTIEHTFDNAGRTTSRIVKNSSGTKLSSWESIVWDDNDNRSSETVNQRQTGGTNLTGAASFSYDLLDRLSSAKYPFEPDTANYALDDAGNITAETGNPTAGGEFSYGFTNNRLMSRTPTNPAAGVFSYGYDRFGNQSTQTQVTETEGTKVTTNTYDAASQPAQTTEPDGSWVRYGYDGMGRMVSRTDSANKTTLFFREAMTQQITVETDGAGANKVRYLLDSSANPLGKEDLNNSTGRSYYVSDPRGNLTQLLDQGENVRAVFAYDPYGKQKTALTNRTGNWDSRLRFQMAPQDPQTGNYSLGARLLDPNINRFVGADNYVGAAANLGLQLDPLTGNRYLYAGANPAGLIDDGHGYVLCPTGVLLVCKTEEKTKAEEDARKKRKVVPPLPRVYVTYTKYNQEKDIFYSGRASGFGDPDDIVAARDRAHTRLNADGYALAVLDRSVESTPGVPRLLDPAYRAIRGREQQLIDFNGGSWSDTGGWLDERKRYTGNKIRGVAKGNPMGRQFHDAASAKWGGKSPYSGY